MRRNAKKIALGLALTASCFSGCSTLNTSQDAGKKSIWSPKTWFEEEYQTPSSVAVIWSPDTLTVSGKPPTRGFGGRLFFYNAKNQSVPVEGELVVHGFMKDESVAKGDPAADKVFRFSSEQLTSHFSPSELGASYSIWIPWDAAGGMREQISLVATFKSSDGNVVQGAEAKLMLPGKSPAKTGQPNSEELPAPNSMMQQVSYQSSSMPAIFAPKPRSRAGVRTTTISVPRESSLTRRRATSFTLGGNTGSDPQTVSMGVKNEQPATTVAVGGGSPSMPEPTKSFVPTSVIPTVKGLPAPPSQSANRMRAGVRARPPAVPHTAAGPRIVTPTAPKR